MPGDEHLPPYEVLAALLASLRRDLADAAAALGQVRTELAQARDRIAVGGPAAANPQNSSKPPSSEGLAKSAPRPPAVAASRWLLRWPEEVAT